MFPKEKLKLLKSIEKDKLNTVFILQVLKDDIEKLLDKHKLPEIIKYLANELDFNKISYHYMQKQLKKTKQKKVIAIVNFKGGVGKSTIANLLELDNKVILNLDIAQDAETINVSDTYNFYSLKEEFGIETIKEAIENGFEAGAEYMILDTPGEMNEFLEILPEIDYFIVPFTNGERSLKTTLDTIDTINEVLNSITNKRKDKWCLVLNKYTKPENLKELDELYEKTKNILKDRLQCKTDLKFSQVVPTIEKKKISINELISQNPIAYGAFKKRIKGMNDEIYNFLGVRK